MPEAPPTVRVYVGGTFDLFHAGHVGFLRHVYLLGHHTTVGLNTDAFAARYKRAPVMSYAEREAVLKACRYVDDVIPNSGEEDSRPSILLTRATIVAHGDDWPREDLMRQMSLSEEWLSEHGVELRQVPYTSGVSTSEVLARCASR